MCDTIFAFGQSGSHFFQCPSGRDYVRLPQKLQRLLSSNQIAWIHHVTLGFEDSFLITWRDRNREDHIDSQKLPPELDSFLYATNAQNQLLRNIPQIRLALGPYNDSFFAHDSSAYQWMNLPNPLLVALQSRIKGGAWLDKPRLVALGCGQDFLLITASHTAVWQLPHYRSIASSLESWQAQAHGIKDVQNVVLHAYRYQCFVAQLTSGKLMFENLPPHEAEGIQGIVERVLRDSKELEEKRRKRIEGTGRRSSAAQRQELLRREWGERKQQFKLEANGLRLSLKLGISAGGD